MSDRLTQERLDYEAEIAALRSKLADAERERDRLRDVLHRLEQWDMFYINPKTGKGIVADGPYWRKEIARALAASPTMTVDPKEEP